MLNLNELSAAIGLPLYIKEDGDIAIDFTFATCKEALAAGLELALLLPPNTFIVLRYWYGTMTTEIPYCIRKEWKERLIQRNNRLRQRPKQSSGDGVTGSKI